VIRHETNRGASAARNTGTRAATAPVVAFLDDDCEPGPEWARELVDAYEEGVIGVGGPLVPSAPAGFMLGYLRRNNPLTPLEMNLAHSAKLLYRLYLYVLRQWAPDDRQDKREVYTLVGANMSFLNVVIAESGLDERFRFGGEDLDVCLQLRRRFPEGRLVVTPDAVVRHHFESSLRDTLRRSRAYGRGCAMLYRKWPAMRPTIFPGPVLVIALVVASALPAGRGGSAPAADVPQGPAARGVGQAALRLARRLCAASPGSVRERRLPSGPLAVPGICP
jgi:GT2 family glycosyltransferase